MDYQPDSKFGDCEDEAEILGETYVDDEYLVCLLEKCLYGLKQASRAWNGTISRYCKSMGFKPTDADPRVYTQDDNDQRCVAAGTPAASAAANTVVASSATTGSTPDSSSVVTSTVTTPSSPKRTMQLGDYKKTRLNALFARDELEVLFDLGSDADMEDGEEEDQETSSLRRDDPSVGSRRPREDA
ncbi:unnamed protein product [Phytophthora fragariaefolia]|uniref:Unnamed protein product n=1 Tax=Phytophthora fragariaefolia TaxID=1490495 RepID=A0A9W6U200_9STRA|nr:unnamed protein product [Phytophthora fragariaefolia]